MHEELASVGKGQLHPIGVVILKGILAVLTQIAIVAEIFKVSAPRAILNRQTTVFLSAKEPNSKRKRAQVSLRAKVSSSNYLCTADTLPHDVVGAGSGPLDVAGVHRTARTRKCETTRTKLTKYMHPPSVKRHCTPTLAQKRHMPSPCNACIPNPCARAYFKKQHM